MEYTRPESGIDMNSSNEMLQEFSSPERLTTTKLTPRALVYDDIDGEGDDMLGMIRRRILGPFSRDNNNSKNHNNNNNSHNADDADKSSMDEDEDTSACHLWTLHLDFFSSLGLFSSY